MVRPFSSIYAERHAKLQKYRGDPQSSSQSRTQIGSWSKIRDSQYLHVSSASGVITVVDIPVLRDLSRKTFRRGAMSTLLYYPEYLAHLIDLETHTGREGYGRSTEINPDALEF